jgi:hypothetical protein
MAGKVKVEIVIVFELQLMIMGTTVLLLLIFQNYVEIKMFLENHVTHLGFHRVGVIEKYTDLTI